MYLVIKRRPGESVLIGDDIRINVLGAMGRNEIRLEIQAPPSVTIIRTELLETEPRRDRYGRIPHG